MTVTIRKGLAGAMVRVQIRLAKDMNANGGQEYKSKNVKKIFKKIPYRQF